MRGELKVIEASTDTARAVLSHLSKYASEDIAISGAKPEDLEKEILVSPVCHVALWNGKAAAMWGVRPNSMFADSGYVWLVTTKVVEEYPFQFIRYGRLIVRDLLRLFPVLHGIVLPKQERNVRWLKLVGFEVSAPEVVFGERYRRFVMRRA